MPRRAAHNINEEFATGGNERRLQSVACSSMHASGHALCPPNRLYSVEFSIPVHFAVLHFFPLVKDIKSRMLHTPSTRSALNFEYRATSIQGNKARLLPISPGATTYNSQLTYCS